MISTQIEEAFVRLRYLLGGYRPSKTVNLKLSSKLYITIRFQISKEWYLIFRLTCSRKRGSQSPTYTAHQKFKINFKIQ